MKKALWFDVETTGLNPKRNDIIQLACMVEIEGNIVETWESKIKPCDTTTIDHRALEVNKLRVEDVLKYPEPKSVLKEFQKVLSKYVDKFNRGDKFAPAGYNVQFDINFLSSFFEKCGDNYYGSYFNYKSIDPLRIVHIMDYERQIDLPNYKLATVCRHYNIPIEGAHEALADIRATRELFKMLRG